MKNVIAYYALFFISLSGLVSCGGGTKTTTIDNPVSGIILDGTMNTVMVATNSGDTLTFSTMDADKSEVNGLLIGDSIQVFYKGTTGNDGLFTATKLIVKHIDRASEKLVGTWLAPINGLPGEEGMKLEEGGIAVSVNMATLKYESWKTTGRNDYEDADYLLLHGKSIGNKQTIDFTDTLKIDKLTSDSLIVSENNYVRAYHRMK